MKGLTMNGDECFEFLRKTILEPWIPETCQIVPNFLIFYVFLGISYIDSLFFFCPPIFQFQLRCGVLGVATLVFLFGLLVNWFNIRRLSVLVMLYSPFVVAIYYNFVK